MTLRRLFWLLAMLFAATAIALIGLDTELRSVHAPHGIVSFEFCGFTDTCAATLDDWGERGRQIAMLSLGLDYLFLLSYAGLLCTALLAAADKLSPRGRRFVGLVAAGAVGAGLADAAENYALIQIVLGADPNTYGTGAGALASAKFGMIIIALLTWASLGIRSLLMRRSR